MREVFPTLGSPSTAKVQEFAGAGLECSIPLLAMDLQDSLGWCSPCQSLLPFTALSIMELSGRFTIPMLLLAPLKTNSQVSNNPKPTIVGGKRHTQGRTSLPHFWTFFLWTTGNCLGELNKFEMFLRFRPQETRSSNWIGILFGVTRKIQNDWPNTKRTTTVDETELPTTWRWFDKWPSNRNKS